MLILNQKYPVKIQFVPGHKELEANEMADLTANAAHILDIFTWIKISKEDKVRDVNVALAKLWQQRWLADMHIHDKGKHLFLSKDNLQFWPWSCHRVRVVETALAKPRIGHVGLKQHLFCFNLADTNLCTCGKVESLSHFLLQCPKYVHEITDMQIELHKMNVSMTVRDMLGGGDYNERRQFHIVDVVAKYLLDTGRIWDL